MYCSGSEQENKMMPAHELISREKLQVGAKN